MDHSRLDLAAFKALKTLRVRIAKAKIPSSRLDESINIATWNIRHWGQKKRKPYMASFKAGNFDFVMLAVHLQWSTTEGRKAELEQLAKWVKTFQKDEFRVDRDVIVLGDFNITSYGSDLYKGGHKSLAPYKDLTKMKFTYERSDHLPLWAQQNVDVEEEQLGQLISPRAK